MTEVSEDAGSVGGTVGVTVGAGVHVGVGDWLLVQAAATKASITATTAVTNIVLGLIINGCYP